MMTLRLFSSEPDSIPASTSWYLADLGEARGKQELFTRQAPQKLKVLREHALIESAISSNRIEGVLVDQSRIGTIIFGKRLLSDRDEQEVRGYRDALQLIHERHNKLPISEKTILELHRISRGALAMRASTKSATAISLSDLLTDAHAFVSRPCPLPRPASRGENSFGGGKTVFKRERCTR